MDKAKSVTASFADISQPTGAISFSSGAYTNSNTVTLNLSASDVAGISKMSFSSDGNNWQAEESFSATKSWILTPGDGNKTVYVKFKDNGGNWSNPYSATVTYDTALPLPAITLPTNNASVTSVLEIRGTVADPAPSSGLAKIEVQVLQNTLNGIYYLQSNGTWVTNPALPYFVPSNPNNIASWNHNTSTVIWTSGQAYTITAKSTDNAGNVASTSSAFTVGTPSAQFSLTVSTTGTGQGTVSAIGLTCNGTTCTGQYSSSAQVALSATAALGSTFMGWSSGGCSGTGTCVVTMDAAKTVTANYATDTISGTTGGGGGGGCFIATAAYGSYFDPYVLILRNFRDKVLLTNQSGQSFVAWYYKVSPPISDSLKTSRTMKAVVRVMLLPTVGFAYLCLTAGVLPGLLILLFSMAFICLGIRGLYCFTRIS